jgi:imidazolonepropionase-like amidohydrolase
MYQRVARGLALRGGRLLAGTDTPNPLMVPGFSLHDEFRVLEQAGIDRRAVLAMATVNPATFLGTPGEFGVVRTGARADLLLLSANPLDNLEALRRPEGVMARGRWYPSARLNQFLEEVARKYR